MIIDRLGWEDGTNIIDCCGSCGTQYVDMYDGDGECCCMSPSQVRKIIFTGSLFPIFNWGRKISV